LFCFPPIFAVETFAFAGLPWVMLLNVAVVAFCANTSVLIIFLPYAMAADRFVLSRQYWIYKIVPVEKSITVVLAAAVTWRSLKGMTTVWQAMEIK
jgi:hypothetical protein